MLKFNDTEIYILRKRYSRQLIAYWQKKGCVPAKQLIAVHELIGRPLEDLIGKGEAA